MNPKEQLKADMENVGLSPEEELLEQLLPIRRRWQQYIKEAREIDVGEVDPAHVFCPKHC